MTTTTVTADYATYGSGSFWVLNNVWGKETRVNGIDYTQTITVDDAAFPNNVVMAWNWGPLSSVLAYPEIIYGASPYTPTPSGVVGPPSTQVANFSNLSTDYSFSIFGETQNFSVGFDMWLTSEPNGGRSTILNELMIVVHNPWGWGANDIPEYTSQGMGLWVTYGWGSGTQAQTWDYLSAIPLPVGDKLSGTFSISDILKTFIWNGVLTGNEYISGIEVGAEIGGGTGSLVINNLSYAWNAKPTLAGTAGDDAFNIASPGGNHVLGNAGIDTVVYSLNYLQYGIKTAGSELLVVENNNISTLDVLNGVEYIKFADGTYDVINSIFSPTIITPNAPKITSFAPDSAKAGDGITKANLLTLTGTADANASVTVFDGTMKVGTTVTNGSGAWTFATAQLADGTHKFTAALMDATGNNLGASSAFNVTVDTLAPATNFTKLVQSTKDAVTLGGTSEAFSTLSIYDGAKAIGTATVAADGTWSFSSGKLTKGMHSFSVQATDLAGNTAASGVAVNGTGGAETLKGGAGNDLLAGGGGADTFVFSGKFGQDVITDFQAAGRSHDVIQVDRSAFASFADVLSHAAQVGGDVVITANSADSITLKNVALSSLSSGDFKFF